MTTDWQVIVPLLGLKMSDKVLVKVPELVSNYSLQRHVLNLKMDSWVMCN